MNRSSSLGPALRLLLPLALLAPSGPALAQESTTEGWLLGLHLTGASLEIEDDDRRYEGGGAGLVVGYGVNRTVSVFLQLDGTSIDVERGTVEGDWAMAHADLGARFHFANPERNWVPYLEAAFTGRVVGVAEGEVDGREDVDVSFSGGALTVGAGFLFYPTETLALELQLSGSGGEFSEIEVENVTVSGLEIDASSGRLTLGVVWWP